MQRSGGEVVSHRASLVACPPNGRLAELVAHLSGCAAPLAVDAVERSLPAVADSLDDNLAIVARAMVLVKHDIERLSARRPA